MNRFRRKLYTEEKGQALVEFAFVLPVLLLLVLGIIQFGMIFSGYITVVSAAREGARIAIVGADDTVIKQKVMDTVGASAFLEEITAGDIEIDPATREQGQMVTVAVNAKAVVVVPILNMGSNFPMSSSAQMRVEYVPIPGT